MNTKSLIVVAMIGAGALTLGACSKHKAMTQRNITPAQLSAIKAQAATKKANQPSPTITTMHVPALTSGPKSSATPVPSTQSASSPASAPSPRTGG
ncbi:MAG: hypothetical protein ACRETC_00875 [Gammaproteobacteria bacterium]